jgi:hypothetical protein
MGIFMRTPADVESGVYQERISPTTLPAKNL